MATRRKRKLRAGRFIATLVILAVSMFALAALGLLVVSIKDLPAWNESSLMSSNATQIYDKDKKLIASVGIENRVPIALNQTPEFVQQAFLAAEDHRFKQHYGIDLRGIARAAYQDVLGGGLHQGASTITQQLVRLSFLNTEKKFKRKVQEIILAIQVERYYSKDEILEMFLNKMYFGEGAYGLHSAARIYFNKDVKQLTLAEAATLAGVLQAPSSLSPYRNASGATDRRNAVLDNMARYGYVSQQEADKAKNEKLSTKEGSPDSAKYPYPYFTDYITSQLIKKYGQDEVYKTGLKVYTSLDPKVQKAVEKVFSDDKYFPPAAGGQKPQGAMVVLDQSNGYIKALVGGREHTHKLGWNRATENPNKNGMQPGSVIKPLLVYAPAIELKGMGPASIIDDAPVKYGNYSPTNYDGKYKGLITMRTAVALSVNVTAVKTLMDRVTIPESIQFGSRMGIKINPSSVGASMALGTEEVTPLQLAGAYSALANQGIYSEPMAILRVEDMSGKVLEDNTPKQSQAMKPTTAYLVTDMLRTVVQSGTGTNARMDRPVAGKTGTTDSSKDIWFTGYTPELVGVVWVGFDTPRPMPQAYGGVYCAKIWRSVMTEALKNEPVKDFPMPPGIVAATVDSKSGLLPGPLTPPEHLVTDLFAQGTVPSEIDASHVLVEVCAESGKLPTEYCPNRVVRSMVKLPYKVSDIVADAWLRAPDDYCTIHIPGGNYDTGQVLPPPEETQQKALQPQE